MHSWVILHYSTLTKLEKDIARALSRILFPFLFWQCQFSNEPSFITETIREIETRRKKKRYQQKAKCATDKDPIGFQGLKGN